MNINSDFSLKVVIHSGDLAWQDSPVKGVQRKPLDRIGDEVARATTIVRYAAGASFSPHVHGGGEEILVLDGVFSDESGDYPTGTYLRNPPSSSHTPKSEEGCTLFVKLRQFHPLDQTTIRVDTSKAPWYPGMVPGLSVMPLHEFDGVGTALVRWAPNTIFNPHVHPGGEEILVLQGVFHDEHGTYPAGSWIRSPRYSKHAPFTKEEGALIYVKTGHLAYPLS
ncbi:cupin domain-containing protein [Zwartia vadi]|uniref:cupin domain-containing protein n=1 Tax=Zwartia vadi TaxID=3058168 RepID=UPI0025B51417|nr:cupin domain-containing protein [Zwartia vadi]MDN3987541.1 cupin domain-containing protein [Zwartia vadi]